MVSRLLHGVNQIGQQLDFLILRADSSRRIHEQQRPRIFMRINLVTAFGDRF